MNRRGSNMGLREERALRASAKTRRRTSLGHLPEAKQAEITWVKNLIFAEFAEAIAGRRAEDVRNGEIVKLILHGPYASGAWVDDPTGAYFADYELLAVVSSDRLADVGEFWLECQRKLLFATANREHLRTPVALTVQSLFEINRRIERGDHYFRKILADGVVLHDTRSLPGPDCPAIPDSDEAAEATLHLEEGLPLVDEFLGSAKLSHTNGWLRKAAFDLHQATERLYNIVLLVFTGHTPHTHNIVQLRKLAEATASQLRTVWPSETREDRRCFELLRSAYNKARYDRYYRVSADEIRWMLDQVEYLSDLTEEVCTAWITAKGVREEQVATPASGEAKLRRKLTHAAAKFQERGEQVVADYHAMLTAHPEPIADARSLPHPKKVIKAALLAELGRAKDLEAIRHLTESFLSLAKWLLLNEHDLGVIEAKRLPLEGGDFLGRREAELEREYAKLINRVSADTIILGAELQHGPLRSPMP